MTIDEIHAILNELKFEDWEFQLTETYDGGYRYLRVSFWADNTRHYSRKWLLSQYMTKSELVQTAFKAVLTAMEHEVREHFLYRGKAIFGPHYDVDALHEIVERTDARKDVPSR